MLESCFDLSGAGNARRSRFNIFPFLGLQAFMLNLMYLRCPQWPLISRKIQSNPNLNINSWDILNDSTNIRYFKPL